MKFGSSSYTHYPIYRPPQLIHVKPRHGLFPEYLYHCVKRYSAEGHCDLNASLCTVEDWLCWRAAVDGEARFSYTVVVRTSFCPSLFNITNYVGPYLFPKVCISKNGIKHVCFPNPFHHKLFFHHLILCPIFAGIFEPACGNPGSH